MLRDITIATPDARLRVTQSDGPGLPIIMLHGSGSSREAFGRQLESPLALGNRLVAIDLPGHGGSSDAEDPAAYTLPALASTITTAIEALKIDRFIVLGWSMGGHVGMEMIGHPGMIGLIACGAPPIAHGPLSMLMAFKPSWDMRLARKEEFTDRDVARYFSLCFGRGATPELLTAIRRADGRARVAMLSSMMRGEFKDERSAVLNADIPIALINGREDPFVRLGYFDGLASSALWHGMPMVIEDAGHAPFWDQPDAFNSLLAAFAEEAPSFRVATRKVA